MNQAGAVSWGGTLQGGLGQIIQDSSQLTEKKVASSSQSQKPKAPKKTETVSSSTKTNAPLSKEEVRKLTDLSTKNEDILKIIEKASGPEGSEAALNQALTLLQSRSSRAQALSNVIRELFDTMKRIIANIA